MPLASQTLVFAGQAGVVKVKRDLFNSIFFISDQMSGSFKKLLVFICVLVGFLEAAVAVVQVDKLLDGNLTQVVDQGGLLPPEGESDVYPDPEFQDLDDNGDGTMSMEEVS